MNPRRLLASLLRAAVSALLLAAAVAAGVIVFALATREKCVTVTMRNGSKVALSNVRLHSRGEDILSVPALAAGRMREDKVCGNRSVPWSLAYRVAGEPATKDEPLDIYLDVPGSMRVELWVGPDGVEARESED